jgi:hypothetical protein
MWYIIGEASPLPQKILKEVMRIRKDSLTYLRTKKYIRSRKRRER